MYVDLIIYMFSRLPVYRGGTKNRMQSQSPPIEDTPTPSQLIYIFIGQIKDRAFYATDNDRCFEKKKSLQDMNGSYYQSVTK